jgi:hypothetical protein
MINTILADIIHYLHILLVLYVISGWIITPAKWIHFYILFVIFILLDWNDYDGECFLTKLEHYFRDKSRGGWSPIVDNNDKISINTENGQPEFFRPLINKTFNIEMSSQDATKLNYFVFIFGILLAFLRLLYHHNIMKYRI